MKDKYPTKKGASGDTSTALLEERTRYARDVAATGDPVDLRTFLDARSALLGLDATIAEASRTHDRNRSWLPHYGYRRGVQQDGGTATSNSSTAPTEGVASSLVSALGASVTDTDTATAPPTLANESSAASGAFITGTAETAALPAEGPTLAPVEAESAVGGGPGIATSLETAYSDSTTLQADGIQARPWTPSGKRERRARSWSARPGPTGS